MSKTKWFNPCKNPCPVCSGKTDERRVGMNLHDCKRCGRTFIMDGFELVEYDYKTIDMPIIKM